MLGAGRRQMRLLAVGDVHGSLCALSELAKWVAATNVQLDAILCTGDIITLDNKDCPNHEQICACEGHMSNIVGMLEGICGRVFYLPGNHDAPTCFAADTTARPKLTNNSVCMHSISLQLAPQLVLVGLGGSIPARKGDDEIEWGAYPYKSDSDLRVALEKLPFPVVAATDAKATAAPTPIAAHIATAAPQDTSSTAANAPRLPLYAASTPLVDHIRPEDDILLLTHVGPFSSSTTVDQVSTPAIYSGSIALDDRIRSLNAHILLNVHGHTHNATGLCRVGQVNVLNPGPLMRGEFAIINLEKRVDLEHWRVCSIEMHTLVLP
eukprot:TRINITY_DN16932_c0_g1_i1.p1 TRINITY_DN16932_c0_g1~~TRINITY_DN16932_c0_g1_i1.p1  ORF type:complete len:323 (-),score=64.65 TRINITY_DN16932_c0_g1_i1:152-1120(-)